MNIVKAGNRMIGPGHPCFIAAEVGINHNGDMALARQMIAAAADAGADAVKFQNYRTEDFLSDCTLTYEYLSQGKRVVEPQYDMFKRYELTRECLRGLREECDKRNVIFFSTPMGEDGVDDLIKAGAPMLKNGSDCLAHLPLIRAMARSGLPTVLSTGMATLAEIDDAVRAFRGAGGKELILLHCTSSYPTPAQDAHLKKIPVLSQAFDCPAGFSDHTWGIVAAIGAVVMGACFVEKHFTLDKNLPGPDHRFSSDPAELRSLVEGIRTVEKNLGESAIGPAPSEVVGRQSYRLSCVAARDLPAGHVVSAEDIAFRRPSTGLPPQAVDWIVGRILKQDMQRGKPMKSSDFS
ncbi:MAG: N-acetylneuraminate synthase family protein [Candidatus Sumerlaeota bacterium]|nr:N-acetylneuraminate synthase family protein [Candidatus Sumerlaeota bacterium]